MRNTLLETQILAMGGATLTLTRCGGKVLTYYDRRTSKKLLDSKRLVTECKSTMAKSKNIEHADVVTETQQKLNC
jgi:hypothetical protein